MEPDLVTLAAPRRGLTLTARLGEGPAQLSGGLGGWEVVPRPGRRPLTIWRGPQETLQLRVPLVIDGHPDRSVEPECRTLELLAGVAPGDPEPEPLVVSGAAIPHGLQSAPNTRWVIDALEWGDVIRREPDAKRVRQVVTVTLSRYIEDETLERVRTRGRAPKYRYVRARKGDTFERIAARELGSKRLGTRLARLNGKRSPDVKLKPGQRVKLPSRETLVDWKRDLKRRR